MATNYVQPGETVNIAQASVSSGDHVVLGRLRGVALTDTDSNGNIQLARKGIFTLSVTGANAGGNTAVSIGDIIYDDSGTLNVDSTNGTEFGVAMETVSSGATASIDVLILE